MVTLPIIVDPTLEALNVILEKEQRPYVSKNIGFGVIGKECSREIWYKINSTEPEIFDADTLRIFRNGHTDEAQMAEDLRKIDGIELHTHDPNRDNKQYKLDALGGRFTGRLDGMIRGLRQAPTSWHVWEHKSANEKKFRELQNAIAKYGVKSALENWDKTYFAQAQSNMFHANKIAKVERHYLTCGTPGLRSVISVRTNLDKTYAAALEDKAERIINATSPPAKISEKSDFFLCRFCNFHGICHK